jgi:hypothetical protein
MVLCIIKALSDITLCGIKISTNLLLLLELGRLLLSRLLLALALLQESLRDEDLVHGWDGAVSC